MKHFLFVVALFFSSLSFAMNEDDVFVTENADGSLIYLMSDECPVQGSKGARVSLILMPDFFIIGCWFLYNERVNVIWFPNSSQPVKSIYDPKIFILERLL